MTRARRRLFGLSRTDRRHQVLDPQFVDVAVRRTVRRVEEK